MCRGEEHIDLWLHQPEKSAGWAKLPFILETAGSFVAGTAWELVSESLVYDHLIMSSRR